MLYTRNCIRCNVLFETNHNHRTLCEDCRDGVCFICGKHYRRTKENLHNCWCSYECKVKYAELVENSGLVLGYHSYVCLICGKRCTSKYKKVVCDDCINRKCAYCGKEFELKFPWTRDTCSTECLKLYRRSTGASKESAQRGVETRRNLYGTASGHGIRKYKKVCKFCGDEFVTGFPRQEYCKGPHYGECPVCGGPSLISVLSEPTPTCSEKCMREQMKRTTQLHFGVDYATQTQYQKDKAKETNLKKYGVEFYSQKEGFKEEVAQIMKEKYGEDPYHSAEIIDKRIQTNLEKYNCTNVMQDPVTRKKAKETFIARYGGIGWGSPYIYNKAISTIIDKYKCTNVMHDVEIRSRIEDTNIKRYKRKSFKGSDEDLLRTKMDPSKIPIFKEFRDNTEQYLMSYESKPTLRQICLDVDKDVSVVSAIICRKGLQYLINYNHVSYIEQTVLDFLKQHVDESRIQFHNRKVIGPKEIDIYIPELKLGFEINPTYTHNSSKPTHHDNTFIVPANYHFNKTVECESKGVRLFHVFGYQWTLKPDIVKSMILNSIGKTPNVYYARKLSLRNVSDAESKRFLNENHIQGYTTSKVRIGLYDEDKLICVMTFSRKRGTMGHKDSDTKDDWDLTRFCTKSFSRCIGGASKLFKYFVEEYKPSSVVSFSDRSNTSGGLYSILGFKFDSFVPPGYVWVDAKTDFYYNRVSTQKNNLRKLFNEPSINIEEKTETQIMEEHGFVKVYNSGLVKWIWKVGEI